MISTLKVIDPGLQTTIQDIPGRKGLRKFGIPVSGTMDFHSAELANWLVGNSIESPLLEITFGNCEFEFSGESVVGITGGEALVSIDERPVQQYHTVTVGSGERLKIGRVSRGARVYLGVSGKWNLNKSFGSFSTYCTAGLGGLEGRELRAGDIIEVDVTGINHLQKEVPDKLIPHFSQHQKIRVIAGPEWSRLSKGQQQVMLNNRFAISSNSNRMGIRLQNKQVLKYDNVEFKSAPVIPGIIQLPHGGQPIILMNDAQSVGGYPRILKVADADLWRLGQVWQGNEISFSLIERRDALELFDYYKELRASHLI